jgi:hypothetical protein
MFFGITERRVIKMKIRLKVRDAVLTATLVDSEAARDFASLLPLAVTMNDLFRREKYAHLPRAISESGKRTSHADKSIAVESGRRAVSQAETAAEAVGPCPAEENGSKGPDPDLVVMEVKRLKDWIGTL